MTDDHDRIITIENSIGFLRELIDSKVENIGVSTKLAANTLEARLEGMNNFRAQLKDQANTFITRAEYNILVNEIQDLKETRAGLAGKASQSSMTITLLIAFGGLVIGIAALIISVVV